MQHISQSIVIHYAGLDLPVVKTEDGTEVVPLKPLADLFGLKWEAQREKVNDGFYPRYLGICTQKAWVATPFKGGASGENQEQTCIRLDRVAAYLMTINPDRVRAKGNEVGAVYLEAKLTEWADALHDYESVGLAINTHHLALENQRMKVRQHIVNLIKAQQASADPANRKLVASLIQEAATKAGYEYTPDLLDTPPAP